MKFKLYVFFFFSIFSLYLNAVINDEMATPQLHAAIYDKDLASVKLLICPTKLEAKDPQGMTPLHAALQAGSEDIVRFLLAEKANNNPLDKEVRTPLLWALNQNRVSTAELLLNHSSVKLDPKSSHFKSALGLALESNRSEILDLLKDYSKKFLLIEALQTANYQELANSLLPGDNNKVIDHKGNTLLHLACKYMDPKAVKIILKKEPNLSLLNNKGNTALDIAIKKDLIMIVKQFMEYEPEAFTHNNDEYKHLALAATNGHFNLVKYLLEKNHFISESTLAKITDEKIKNYINLHKKSIDFLQTKHHTLISQKHLNLANQNTKIPATISFEKIPSEKELYLATFDFIFGKKAQSKSMVVKPRYAEDNSKRIDTFEFYKLTSQGYVAQKSLSFMQDTIYIKNSKTGKNVRDLTKVLFINNFKVDYNENLGKLTLKMITDKNSSETIELSSATEMLPGVSQEKKPISPSSKEDAFFSPSKDTKPRPKRSDFIGSYEGTSTYQPVAYAEIKDNRLWLMFSNNETLDFEITTNGDGVVSSLRGIPNFGGWQFTDKFEVYLQGDHLVLECAEAKKKQKQSFLFTLTKTNKVKPIIISVEEEASHVQLSNVSKLEKKPAKIAVEPEAPGLSKNQRKKQARKRIQQVLDNLAQKDLMPDVPEAKSAPTLPPHKEEHQPEFSKNSPPQTPPTIAHEKAPISLGEKDTGELLGNAKPRIQLKPTPHVECPLFQKNIVWEGVATSLGHETLNDKKLLLSLTNFQNRKGVWGSLWATALGKEDNYANGKNIHWSYHKQDNGDEYLYISHHYLFKIIKSVMDNGYTLQLISNNPTKRINDVEHYKVYPKNIEDITISYIIELFGINHHEVHEEELLDKHNKTYERILKHLAQQNFNGDKDFDLYFISEKTWELFDITNNKRQIINVTKDTITVQNRNKKRR